MTDFYTYYFDESEKAYIAQANSSTLSAAKSGAGEIAAHEYASSPDTAPKSVKWIIVKVDVDKVLDFEENGGDENRVEPDEIGRVGEVVAEGVWDASTLPLSNPANHDDGAESSHLGKKFSVSQATGNRRKLLGAVTLAALAFAIFKLAGFGGTSHSPTTDTQVVDVQNVGGQDETDNISNPQLPCGNDLDIIRKYLQHKIRKAQDLGYGEAATQKIMRAAGDYTIARMGEVTRLTQNDPSGITSACEMSFSDSRQQIDLVIISVIGQQL